MLAFLKSGLLPSRDYSAFSTLEGVKYLRGHKGCQSRFCEGRRTIRLPGKILTFEKTYLRELDKMLKPLKGSDPNCMENSEKWPSGVNQLE